MAVAEKGVPSAANKSTPPRKKRVQKATKDPEKKGSVEKSKDLDYPGICFGINFKEAKKLSLAVKDSTKG